MMAKWRDAAKPPAVGVEALVYAGGRVHVGIYRGAGRWLGVTSRPTVWMRLPPPPDGGGAQNPLDIAIGDTGWPPRIRNACECQGIRYVGDLVQRSEAELLGFRNFGRASLRELRRALWAMGLTLGMTVDWDAP